MNITVLVDSQPLCLLLLLFQCNYKPTSPTVDSALKGTGAGDREREDVFLLLTCNRMLHEPPVLPLLSLTPAQGRRQELLGPFSRLGH